MKEYTFYTSQPFEDETPYVAESIKQEANSIEKIMKASGYSIIKKWFKKEGGYDIAEVQGVKK